MKAIVENYYKQAGIMPLLLKSKMSKLEKHPDIMAEFVHWIDHLAYKETGCVCIEGYTAKMLSELSEFTDGEAAFMLLIELREAPDRALRRIKAGFTIK